MAATFSVVFASLMALVAVCWGGYHLTRVFAEAFKCRKELLKASLDAGGYREGDFLRLCFALSVVALVVLIAAGVWAVLPVFVPWLNKQLPYGLSRETTLARFYPEFLQVSRG